MGKRGPAPKPNELKIAEGTFRPSAHGEVIELGTAVDFLPMPASLQDIEGGPEAWHELHGKLVDSGILQGIDSAGLEMAAAALANFRNAGATLKQEGRTVDGRFGPVAHPAIKEQRDAANDFKGWAQRYGMTPSDRAGLGMAVLAGRKAAQGWGDLDDDTD